MLRLVKRFMRHAAAHAAAPLLAPIYAGMATILLFHRVVPPPRIPRSGWVRDLESDPSLLEDLVSRLARAGHAFVSLDELHEALLRPRRQRRGPRKLVVFTFDDGYADVYHTAFPLLAGRGVPFTLYLTTGFPDHSVAPWWYPLESALAAGGRLTLSLGGRERAYRADSPPLREAAFEEIEALFDAAPAEARLALAEEAFGAEVVARAKADLYLQWDEVERMAAHPLVTIGAHTVNHPVLRAIPPEEARREMSESRRRIEARLGRPVRHFAYPYGQPRQAGPREYALARECGFDTAVTTCLANVFPESAGALTALPRIYGNSRRSIELSMSGVPSAYLYRGRRVVTG